MRKLPNTNTKEFHPAPGDPRTQRKCGKCTACCTVIGVSSLEKPPNSVCEHECGKGCRIYTERPEQCASYTCLWLEGWLESRHKPHRFGLIFDRMLKGEGGDVWDEIPFVVVRPVRPNAHKSREARVVLEGLSKRMIVMLLLPGTRKLSGPKDLLDQLMTRVGGGNELEPIPGEPNRFKIAAPE